MKRGWIDYVVLSTWNNTDPQLPVDQFTRFTKPAGVDTIVVMGNMIGTIDAGPPKILDRPVAMSAKHTAHSYQAMLLTESEARAAAANYYTWGADSISFWNVGIHFGGETTAAPEQQARMARWTQAVRSKETVFAGPRTYRYLPLGKGISRRKPPARNYPWYDEGRSPLGHVNSPILTFDSEQVGKRLVFPFRMADGRDGEKLTGKITFWIYHLTENDELTIDVNGRPIDPAVIHRFDAGARRGGLPGQRFEIDLADCPPFQGDNELGLTLHAASAGEHPPYMEELEVTVEAVTQQAATSARPPVKIYIAVDSEGPTGVAEYWARNLEDDDPELQHYRKLMTDDVNAAIDGCFQAGADEVFVSDDGFRDHNLLAERLDKRATLITGGDGLLNGLDRSFSGVMLIGFHAREGADDPVLAHTWSSTRRRRYWFNGREGGEVAAYAIVASHDHDVPIILATGCRGLCREVHDLLGPQVLTVAVKELREDRSVALFPQSQTLTDIADAARRAVETIDEFEPFPAEFPLQIRLVLKDKSTTDGYIQWRRKNKPAWPGRRVDDVTLEATLTTTRHIVL